MKVAIFGGNGVTGELVTRAIAVERDVAEIFIADIRPPQLSPAPLPGNSGYVHCDIRSHGTVREIMSAADVAIGCVGPFDRYEENMVRAAIETKRPYISVCDDCSAVEKSLALDKQAKMAGVTIVSGCGFSPGITNLLAAKGIEMLDTVNDVTIIVLLSLEDTGGNASVAHILRILTEKPAIFKDGRWHHVNPMSMKTKFHVSSLGRHVTIAPVAHPETTTIPHFFKQVENTTVMGALIPEWSNYIGTVFKKIVNRIGVGERDFIPRVLNALRPVSNMASAEGSIIRVTVTGEGANRNMRFTAQLCSRPSEAAARAATVAALMLARRQITQSGVFAPEAIISPSLFFAELSHLKVFPETSLEYV